jgi:ApaG protein
MYPELNEMYESVTRDILVAVEPIFLEEESNPDENHFVWAYTIAIENMGDETVQLRSRYWRITDSSGNTQEVRGDGVVGEQPVILPGESFEYTSGAPLGTPTGFMGGTYRMETSKGELFDVMIPTFSLDSPHQVYSLH